MLSLWSVSFVLTMNSIEENIACIVDAVVDHIALLYRVNTVHRLNCLHWDDNLYRHGPPRAVAGGVVTCNSKLSGENFFSLRSWKRKLSLLEDTGLWALMKGIVWFIMLKRGEVKFWKAYKKKLYKNHVSSYHNFKLQEYEKWYRLFVCNQTDS